jgi:hypothetical protein
MGKLLLQRVAKNRCYLHYVDPMIQDKKADDTYCFAPKDKASIHRYRPMGLIPRGA